MEEPARHHADLRLARRAIAENWPMPPERRATLMAMLYTIATTPTHTSTSVIRGGPFDGQETETTQPNHRNQVAAAKAILAAAKMDQDDRHHGDNLEIKRGELALGVADAVSKNLTEDDWLRVATLTGRLADLPERLRDRAVQLAGSGQPPTMLEGSRADEPAPVHPAIPAPPGQTPGTP